MPNMMNPPLFPLGRVVATPDALDRMARLEIDPVDLLLRHQHGDWGTVDAHDKRANNRAVKDGTRILSQYGEGNTRLWIITEWDRSVTTILLPGNY